MKTSLIIKASSKHKSEKHLFGRIAIVKRKTH